MGGTCGKRKKSLNISNEVIEGKTITPNTIIANNVEDEQEIEAKTNNAITINGEESFLVGKIRSIRDDKFTEVQIGEKKSVLVARHGDNFFAIGSKCPHAGASLANGVLINGKVRCPWHAACFDIQSGDLEDFPGFDCIPSYKVEVEECNLYVKVNPNTMVDRRQKSMKKLTQRDQKMVIIGSGPSGYSCAQTLREEGYEGRIILVTADAYLPYDRTKLTKKLGCTWEDIKIRDQMFYDDNDIEVIVNATVKDVNVETRSISFHKNSIPQLNFDFLFIAVGMRPRLYDPRLSGDDLQNIHSLHSLEECIKITEKVHGMDVILIGSSFISMELAELLSPVASQIHILSRSKVPYSVAFGNPTGEALLGHFLQKLPNVTFHPATEVQRFLGNDAGEVCGVVTTTEETINCQLVVIAIGGVANTEFLAESRIELNPKTQSIIVNEYLETSCTNIFGGGDAVTFPFNLAPGVLGTVAHWQLASRHGKIAALNILGRQESVRSVVPFFWTNVCGLQVRYVGYGDGHDETLVFGNMETLRFCVVYRRSQLLTAVCCVGCGNLASELALIFQNNMEFISTIPDAITSRFP